jgi:protein-L-isoaspartate(D-aspartate) O-methyltransferase
MVSEEEQTIVRREEMVSIQIEGRGIRDAAVLSAMRTVPRHFFVDSSYQEYAYGDSPLPIPARQTISQPYVVALMICSLRLTAQSRVLEVGTGSGYAAALLSLLATEVITIERHPTLVAYARERLAELGCNNVRVFEGDGSVGRPDYSPFDGIVVAAGGPSVPDALCQQLAIGGRLVMPVGRKKRQQQLLRITRRGEADFTKKELGPVAFVPLIGEQGWKH